MYKLRHGSESRNDILNKAMNYDQIGIRMKLAASTVHKALRRYERDGCKFIEVRRTNWKSAWYTNTKLKAEVKDYLLSYNCLTKWAGLPLR